MHAVVAVTLLLPVAVLFLVLTIRVLTYFVFREVWITYAVLGTLFALIGVLLWSRRHSGEPAGEQRSTTRSTKLNQVQLFTAGSPIRPRPTEVAMSEQNPPQPAVRNVVIIVRVPPASPRRSTPLGPTSSRC